MPKLFKTDRLCQLSVNNSTRLLVPLMAQRSFPLPLVGGEDKGIGLIHNLLEFRDHLRRRFLEELLKHLGDLLSLYGSDRQPDLFGVL